MKHCWERRNCWLDLPVFSTFPTIFSNIFLRVLKSKLKNLQKRDQATNVVEMLKSVLRQKNIAGKGEK